MNEYSDFSDAERLEMISSIHNSGLRFQNRVEKFINYTEYKLDDSPKKEKSIINTKDINFIKKLENCFECSIRIKYINIDLDPCTLRISMHDFEVLFKELLENAIDAQATNVKLIVKDGGKALIQVIDNGVGLTETDARLAFERHATSKIATAEDLFSLSTKGFRGEALASIAAIAHVDLQTKREGSELGCALKIEGSEVVSQDVTVTPKGSSLAVKNLFFNIPARRNFLKSNQVELRHIIDEFHRVALVHHDVAFQFYNNGSKLFNLISESFRRRIVHVFGAKMNERLVPVEEKTDVVNIRGFVCKPEFAKKSRGEQFFFANGRFIKSPYLHHAVSNAFEGLIKPDCQPGYFLFLEVDSASIDINIHPTKTEVKFDDENTLYAILRSTIKHSLGQFNIAPVIDFDRNSNLDTPYNYNQKKAILPKVVVDSGFNPFENDTISQKTNRSFQKQDVQGWKNLYTDVSNDDTPFSTVHFETEVVSPGIFESQNDAFETEQKTFQIQRKYVVTTIKSGMLLIDQNRAHKRVLFDRFLCENENGNGTSQQLLFPIKLDFTKNEINLLQNLASQLRGLGFVMSFTDRQISVTGIPSMMTESSIAQVLQNLLTNHEEEKQDTYTTKEITAKVLCESLAVKTGHLLEPESQIALVNDLFGCDEPKLDPFGKTTYITIGVDEIVKKFM